MIGAVKDEPPDTIEVDSLVDVTTEESVVGNAPVPVLGFVGAFGDEDAPATTELSSVGKRDGAVGLGFAADPLAAVFVLSGFCGKLAAPPRFAFSMVVC